MLTRHRILLPLLTLCVLAAGVAFRLHGHDWDRRTLQHPDERFLAMTVERLRVPPTLRAYLDGHVSPLNPRPQVWFAYGTLPTTITRLTAQLRGPVVSAQRAADTGRFLAAAADLGTLLLVGWLGRRLFGAWTGLLAATFYTCAVLPIQHAHFFVVDPFLTLASTLAVTALAVVHQDRSWRAALVAGVATGMAVACKVSGAALLLPCVVVAGTHLWHGLAEGHGRRSWRALVWVALLLVAAAITVRLAAPDMFSGLGVSLSGSWRDDMREIAEFTRGRDWPPAHQWAGRGALFPYWNLVAWGLGWPLGLVALVALAEATWRALADWRSPVLVPACWTLVVFVTGTIGLVTTMRYLLPAYPMLCLLAAWGLVAGLEASRARRAPWFARAFMLAIAITVAGTLAWALAFDEVYRAEHPRLRASRWIYTHVPAGTALASEAWDDSLPLPMRRDWSPSRYRNVTLPVVEDETPAKLDTLLDRLSQVDYVILASDRAAGTLVRLPARFPMMARYYAALDDGRLGFDLVQTFRTTPRLATLTRPDLAAEEAFTVYDHPRVRIFRKRRGWSAAQARQALELPDWTTPVRVSARQANSAPNLLALPEARRASLATEGTWRAAAGGGGRFGARPPTGAAAVGRWTALVAIVWLLAWPGCAVLLRGAWLRGTLVAPALGLLWVGWVTWLWGSLARPPVTWGVLAVSVASVGIVSALLAWPARIDLRDWIGAHRRQAAAAMAGVAVVYGAGLLLRWANPDLWHPGLGGEKMMDLAILNALVRADHFPPPDPWFAGGILNYYYFGHVPLAVLSRLTGIEPTVAYNLSVPLLWSLVAGGSATAAATLARAIDPEVRVGGPAVGGAVLAALAGNLSQWQVVWTALHGDVPSHHWFWNASRAIPASPGDATITEFPYFTVLFGDLHAHLLSMPWLIAVLVLATTMATTARDRDATRALVSRVVLGGLLVAALSMTNTWDVPLALALLAAGFVSGLVAPVSLAQWPSVARACALAVGGLLVISRLAAAPFWATFGPPAGGVEAWAGPRSPLWALALVWGPFLLAGIAALEVTRFLRDRRPVTIGHAWAALLFVLGLGLLATTELLAVQGDVGRMNLVFKVYLQLWLVGSAAAAALVATTRLRLRPGASRRLFDAAWAVMLALMLAYPFTATLPRVRERVTPVAPRTLDGRAFLHHARVEVDRQPLALDEDARIIEWLLDHAPGTPTVMEAVTDAYQWGARLSSYTGLPTVAGWRWHTKQQRQVLPPEVVDRRLDDVRAFFASPDRGEALRIARRYDVRYAVIGAPERRLYPAEGLAKFDGDPSWAVAHRAGSTVLYERRR